MSPGREQETKPPAMLPFAAPDCPYARLLLFAVRRMAAGGLNDAFAAQALLAGFGVNFRRPLALLRALMAEVSRVSTTKLLVAPCCCGRMTDDERHLLAAIATAGAAPRAAHRALTAPAPCARLPRAAGERAGGGGELRRSRHAARRRVIGRRRDPSRPLTPGERGIAAALFGTAIDPEAVRVHRARWWPPQPRAVAMAPDGDLWLHPDGPLWRDDYAAAEPALTALFAHELTHVWQHQRGLCLPLRRHPFCRYRYRLIEGRPLERYGIEQQAMIVQHGWGPAAARAGARALCRAAARDASAGPRRAVAPWPRRRRRS